MRGSDWETRNRWHSAFIRAIFRDDRKPLLKLLRSGDPLSAETAAAVADYVANWTIPKKLDPRTNWRAHYVAALARARKAQLKKLGLIDKGKRGKEIITVDGNETPADEWIVRQQVRLIWPDRRDLWDDMEAAILDRLRRPKKRIKSLR